MKNKTSDELTALTREEFVSLLEFTFKSGQKSGKYGQTSVGYRNDIDLKGFYMDFKDFYKAQLSDKPMPIISKNKNERETIAQETFKMPTDKQLVDIAILFSQDKGIINKVELANMIAMSEFILNRLHENKDVMIPSTIESKD